MASRRSASASFDARAVRADFPLLAESPAGKGLRYLDNAATTHKPRPVIEAIAGCYAGCYGPVHRGLYPLAESASGAYEEARTRIARFIGAAAAECVVFTRSATESLNLVAMGWAQQRLAPGDEVWVSRLEHHSNFLPWQRLCKEHGARLRLIELDGDGRWDLARAEREGLYGAQTRVISVSLVSNVFGLRNPAEELIERAHARGIAVAVDAAQAVAHMPVDVAALDCDFLAFSGHKMYGPDGIGVLYVSPGRRQEMEPLLLGGGMVDQVDEQWSSWAPVPARLEAGSPNLAGALGLAAAAEYLEALGRARVHEHLRQLAMDARAALRKHSGIRLYAASAAELQTGIVTFDVAGIHPHDVAQVAGEHRVALRAGHHCCQPLMHALGVPALVRASFGIYNDRSDVDALAAAVGAAQRLLGGCA